MVEELGQKDQTPSLFAMGYIMVTQKRDEEKEKEKEEDLPERKVDGKSKVDREIGRRRKPVKLPKGTRRTRV